MKSLLHCLALAACVWAGPLAQAAEEKTIPDETKAAAVAWLGLLDQEQYAQSWKDSSTRLKNILDEKMWVQLMTKQRKPLGKSLSREFESAKFTRELPRQPEGEYWIVEFHSSFEGAKSTTETVTVGKDKEGKWRVLAHRIRPAAA